jgi:platelet-activating factor acetylhydrolase
VYEVLEGIRFIHQLNEGDLPRNALCNNSSEADKAQSLGIETSFRDRLDLSSLIVSGHSFGAATILTFLQRFERGDYKTLLPPTVRIPCGILLDTWMYAVSLSEQPLKTPLLSVVSDQFRKWQENFDAHQQLLSTPRHPHSLLTIRGSNHIDQSDFPVLLPSFLRRSKYYFGGDLDPEHSNNLSLLLSGVFIKKWVTASDIPIDQLLSSDLYQAQLLEGDDTILLHD